MGAASSVSMVVAANATLTRYLLGLNLYMAYVL